MILLKGILIGFSIAAPVGPIGVLCIRRTLAGSRAIGLASGLGAATADACYGSIVAFGLTALSGFLVGQQAWLRPLGAAFLLYLGVKTFLARPASEAAAVRGAGLGLPAAYASTFLLTLTNPATIVSFFGIFAGLGIAGPGTGRAAAALLVCGVFLGSSLWWLILSGGVGAFREKIDARRLHWINRASGIIIAAFGVAALVTYGNMESRGAGKMNPNLKPDAIIKVRFNTTAEGGRNRAVEGGVHKYYGCPMVIDGDRKMLFDCRLLLNGRRLELGETYEEVEVKFLSPDLVLPRLKQGTTIILWEGKDVATGTVENILESKTP